ncbi:MAG: HAD hydrolase-like protein [Bacteroidetes bacterium]|nr:HAD hydrolase-like protein [Bacteroidota bacterium]
MNNTLIIFDIDGTLTDSIKVHQDLYAAVLGEMKLKKEEEFGTYKHHTDRFIFCEIYFRNHGVQPDEEIIKQFYELTGSRYAELTAESKVDEIRGARSFIKEQLEPNGVPYVFATGSIARLALAKLESFNIGSIELLLSTSDEMDSREEIVLDAVAKAKIFYKRKQFDKAIIIGDGKWDYLTAKNLNMGFLGIGNNPALKEMLGDTPAMWNDFSGRMLSELWEQAIF